MNESGGMNWLLLCLHSGTESTIELIFIDMFQGILYSNKGFAKFLKVPYTCFCLYTNFGLFNITKKP